MSYLPSKPINLRAQRGAILIAVLAILIALTLLGLAGVRSTTLEERMVGNFQEKYLAFQAAETAARVAEGVLDNAVVRADLDFDGSDGSHEVTEDGGAVDPFSAFSTASNYVAVDVDGQHEGTAYFIERVPERPLAKSSLVVGFPSKVRKVQIYRVTARGFGRGGETEVIVQTTWAQ